MQAVILAAGRGVRMGAITETTPKPMVPILGKPLLEWKINALPDTITEVIVTTGYLGEQIREYFGTEWQGKKMTYVHQEVLNGSAGSVQLTEPFIRGPILVTMGDDLYHPEDLMDFLKTDPKEGAIGGLYVENAQAFGLIDIDENGQLQSVVERPHNRDTGLVCTGSYFLPEKYFDYGPVRITETEYGLPQTVVLMSQDISVRLITARAWQPVGCPEDIPQAEAFIRKYYF